MGGCQTHDFVLEIFSPPYVYSFVSFLYLHPYLDGQFALQSIDYEVTTKNIRNTHN